LKGIIMGEQISCVKFTLQSEFRTLLRQCFGSAQLQLQLFDPDFSVWALGSSETIEALRAFLLTNGKARIEMVTHRTAYLERDCPRFMRLLAEFSHAIECRVTPKNLQQLTDSLCIADDVHMVRRFHADHYHGEAVCNAPAETPNWRKRFSAIWIESDLGLHASTTGL
jgi:hypothetical protein